MKKGSLWLKNPHFIFLCTRYCNLSSVKKTLSSYLVLILVFSLVFVSILPLANAESMDTKTFAGDTKDSSLSSPAVVKTSTNTAGEIGKDDGDTGSDDGEKDNPDTKSGSEDTSGGDDTTGSSTDEEDNDASSMNDVDTVEDTGSSNTDAPEDNAVNNQIIEKHDSLAPKTSIVTEDTSQFGNNSSLDNQGYDDVNTTELKSFDVKTYEFQKSIMQSTGNTAENESKTYDASLNIESSIGNVTKGETISVNTADDDKDKSCIQRIDFKTSENQKNVTLSVSKLVEKPNEIKNELNLSVNDQVYTYLDIKLTADLIYIGESGIDQMTFNFTIEKTWIENQSIDKEQVKMMRYHNDTWQELNTSYDGETDAVIYYHAETPGLSIFAVVGNKIVEESDDVVVESSSFPWWMPTGVIIFSTTALGIVLFKKRFVYQA